MDVSELKIDQLTALLQFVDQLQKLDLKESTGLGSEPVALTVSYLLNRSKSAIISKELRSISLAMHYSMPIIFRSKFIIYFGYQLMTGQIEVKSFVVSLSNHEWLNRPPFDKLRTNG